MIGSNPNDIWEGWDSPMKAGLEVIDESEKGTNIRFEQTAHVLKQTK